MSLGTQFLSVVLAENDRRALGQIRTEWLNEEEQTAYDAIVDHLRRHGGLPTHESMRRIRVNLPAPERLDEVAYYIHELPRRAIHNFVREHLGSLSEHMEGRNLDGVIGELREMHQFAALTANINTVIRFEDEVAHIVEEMRSRRGRNELLGIATGFPILDEVMNGYQPGDVNVTVGRPSVGKSWLLFKQALAAWSSGVSVLIVSMEMSVRQSARRILGMETGINPNAIRKGHLSSFAEADFYRRVTGLEGRPAMHFLAGDVSKTVDDIDQIVAELMPQALYVDAAYLTAPSRKRQRSSRREFIADTVEEFKGLAVRRNIPTQISVQFSRKVTKDMKKGLDLSMIGEADAIGQIASSVIGVRPGPGVYAQRRRTCTLMKNREGEDWLEWETNFRHSPINFDQIPGTEKKADGKAWVSLSENADDDGADETVTPGSTDTQHQEELAGYVD